MNTQELIERLNFLRGQELFAIQQYMHHHYIVKGLDFKDIQGFERDIAIAEMRHAEALAEKINMLGGNPINHPGEIEQLQGRSVMGGEESDKMVRADLGLEREAIESYTKAIQDLGDADSGTRKLLEDILVEEEEHADTFATWLGEDVAYEIGKLRKAG